MTFTEQSLPIIPEDAEVLLAQVPEVKPSRFAGLIKRLRAYFPGLTFVAGLLLGWLVIGWWLWPVQWTNSNPWHLNPKHQRTFIRLVAEDYWLTGNVSQVQETLAGWDSEALASLLATMEAQSPSPEERQRLVALAEALEMPDAAPPASFVTSLLGQKTILLGVILSASPLVVAMILAISRLRGKDGPGEIQEQWIEAQQAQVKSVPGQQVGKQEEIESEASTARPQEQKPQHSSQVCRSLKGHRLENRRRKNNKRAQHSSRTCRRPGRRSRPRSDRCRIGLDKCGNGSNN